MISYAIGTHNETTEITVLVNLILDHLSDEDEIIIVDDYSDDPETIRIIGEYEEKGIKVYKHRLAGDFAQHKNFMISKCTQPYIFNIDADELPHEALLINIKDVIELNENVDLFYIPRINTVEGITIRHITNWNWNVSKLGEEIFGEMKKKVKKSELKDNMMVIKTCGLFISETDDEIEYHVPIINPPDIQGRLFKNKPNIRWEKPVHERIVGSLKPTVFPMTEEFCLYHMKKIKKQESQNEQYDEILENI